MSLLESVDIVGSCDDGWRCVRCLALRTADRVSANPQDAEKALGGVRGQLYSQLATRDLDGCPTRCRRLLAGFPRCPLTGPVHIVMKATASSAVERSYAGALRGPADVTFSRPEGHLRLAASTPASPPSPLRLSTDATCCSLRGTVDEHMSSPKVGMLCLPRCPSN